MARSSPGALRLLDAYPFEPARSASIGSTRIARSAEGAAAARAIARSTTATPTITDRTWDDRRACGCVPQVLGGFTDSHFFRDLGIVSYGFEATATPHEDVGGVHGNDERVTEENVRRGVRMTLEILQRFAATRRIM